MRREVWEATIRSQHLRQTSEQGQAPTHYTDTRLSIVQTELYSNENCNSYHRGIEYTRITTFVHLSHAQGGEIVINMYSRLYI